MLLRNLTLTIFISDIILADVMKLSRSFPLPAHFNIPVIFERTVDVCAQICRTYFSVPVDASVVKR